MDTPTGIHFALQRIASSKAAETLDAVRSVNDKFHSDNYLESTETVGTTKQKAQDVVHLWFLEFLNLIKLASNALGAVADLSKNAKEENV